MQISDKWSDRFAKFANMDKICSLKKLRCMSEFFKNGNNDELPGHTGFLPPEPETEHWAQYYQETTEDFRTVEQFLNLDSLAEIYPALEIPTISRKEIETLLTQLSGISLENVELAELATQPGFEILRALLENPQILALIESANRLTANLNESQLQPLLMQIRTILHHLQQITDIELPAIRWEKIPPVGELLILALFLISCGFSDFTATPTETARPRPTRPPATATSAPPTPTVEAPNTNAREIVVNRSLSFSTVEGNEVTIESGDTLRFQSCEYDLIEVAICVITVNGEQYQVTSSQLASLIPQLGLTEEQIREIGERLGIPVDDWNEEMEDFWKNPPIPGIPPGTYE